MRGPNSYNFDHAVQVSTSVPDSAVIDGVEYPAFPLLIGIYCDKTNSIQKTVDICRIVNHSLPFAESRKHMNNFDFAMLPIVQKPNSNCGKQSNNRDDRLDKFQAQQIAISAILAYFEGGAKHGILVSGINTETNEREFRVAFLRLFAMDADNECHWDLTGCRRCFKCGVNHADFDKHECICGNAISGCSPLTSAQFNQYRDGAVRYA